jgi:hypothetical protein
MDNRCRNFHLAASRLVAQSQIDSLIANGLEVISCGANVPFADKEIFWANHGRCRPQSKLIPDFISNCGMARVFCFMEKVQMTDEPFFTIPQNYKKSNSKSICFKQF